MKLRPSILSIGLSCALPALGLAQNPAASAPASAASSDSAASSPKAPAAASAAPTPDAISADYLAGVWALNTGADAAERLRLVGEWGRAAASAGRLGEAFAKLEEAQKGGRSTLLEQSELLLLVSDYPAAADLLEKALAALPASAERSALRQQALRVAQGARWPGLVLRYLREVATEEPTPAHSTQLFVALVENALPDEARQLLAAHGADLQADPLALRVVYKQLWELELARPAADALRGAAGWQAALVRAELLLTEGEDAQAAPLLWSLFDRQLMTVPLPEPADAQYLSAQTRLTRVNNMLSAPPLVLAPGDQNRNSERTMTGQNLREARDVGLAYLGVLGAEDRDPAAFIGRAREALALLPVVDQLVAWSIIENFDGFVAAATQAVAEEKLAPELNQFCLDRLNEIATTKGPYRELAQRAAGLRARFESRFVGAAPGARFPRPERALQAPVAASAGRADYSLSFTSDGVRPAYLAFRAGDFAKARSLFEAELSKLQQRRSTASTPVNVTPYAVSLIGLVARPGQAADKVAESAAVTLASLVAAGEPGLAYGGAPKADALWRMPIQIDGRLDRFFYDGYPGVERSSDEPGQEDGSARLAPPPQLLDAKAALALFQLFRAVRAPAVWPLFKARWQSDFADATPAARRMLQIQQAYLLWWHGERDEARQMIATLQAADPHSPGLVVALANMLRLQAKPAEAVALIASFAPPYPGFARISETWQLRLAGEMKDKAAVERLAPRVAAGPLSRDEFRSTADSLEQAGFVPAARLVSGRLGALAATQDPGAVDYASLDDVKKAGGAEAGASFARLILAMAPPGPRITETRAARQRAVALLATVGQGEAYLAEMQRLAEAAPGDWAAAYRVAEALPRSTEESTKAWMHVLELSPTHNTAAQLLLGNLRTSAKPEHLNALLQVLARQPESVLRTHTDASFAYFKEANRLPDLAHAIASAPFRAPQRGRTSQNGRNYQLDNLARRFANETDAAAAAEVLGKALSVLGYNTTSLRRLLLECLLKLGPERLPDARRELLEYLLPQAPAARLVFMREPDRPPFNQPERPELDSRIFTLISSLGIEQALRERAAALPPSGANGPDNNNDPNHLQLLLHAVAHDPAVLPEIQQLAQSLTPKSRDTAWLTPLVELLASWPEAREVNRELLLAAEKISGDSPYSRVLANINFGRLALRAGHPEVAGRFARAAQGELQKQASLSDFGRMQRGIAEIAAAAGDIETLAECGRALFTWVEAHQRSYISLDDAFRVGGLLAEHGRAAEMERLIAAISKTSANNSGSVTIGDRLRALRSELDALHGVLRDAAPVLWHDADRSTTEEATLVWDLGLQSRLRYDGSSTLLVRALPQPKLDGQYDLELLYGETPDAMRSLAVIGKAPNRGTWKGALPPGPGYVRAVFNGAEGTVFGPVTFVCHGPNLLREATDRPDAAPWGFPAEVSAPKDGGPCVSGQYVTLPSSDREVSGSAANQPILARQVKVRTGQDYILSGWLRSGYSGTNSHSVRLQWQCLDAQGKVLSGSNSGYSITETQWWSYTSLRLSWPTGRGSRYGIAEMPVGTVYLRPIIEGGRTGFDLAGLSLVAVPAKKAGKEDAAEDAAEN